MSNRFSDDPKMLDARQEANFCPHDHACLEDKREHLCKIAAEYGDKVLFLKRGSPQKKSCLYYYTFGEDGICTCPVRYRLYSEYGI